MNVFAILILLGLLTFAVFQIVKIVKIVIDRKKAKSLNKNDKGGVNS